MALTLDQRQVVEKMLEAGLIDQATLSRVTRECPDRHPRLLRTLATRAGLTSEKIRQFVHERFGVPEIDLDGLALNPAVVRLVPGDVALAQRMVPAFKILGCTQLAVSDPFNLEGLKEIQFYVGEDCNIILAPEDQVVKAIVSYNGQGGSSSSQGTVQAILTAT